jgi:glutathione S-transferase
MKLYIDHCWTCSRIRQSLGELAMAYEVVVVPREGQADHLPQGTQPPVLLDDGRIIQGSGNIFSYIDELQELKRVWLKYQSDVCYMDEDSCEGC